MKRVIIAKGKYFFSIQHQDISWANPDSLSIAPLGTNVDEIDIKILKSTHGNKIDNVVYNM